MHRPVGLALVTERLDRWRDGSVSVVVLWRAGPRVLRLLAHRSGRMRAQYNTCPGNIARAVAGPPRSGVSGRIPKKTRCVAPARGCLLCHADRLIHSTFTFTGTTVVNIYRERSPHSASRRPARLPVRSLIRLRRRQTGPASVSWTLASRLARIPREQRVQHPRVRQPLQRQARVAQRIDLRMLERHARQRTILRKQRRI